MGFRTVAAGMILVSTSVHAQSESAALQPVEVVGSRVPRIAGETALPVQVIRREEIERSGVATTEELLKLVSANFGGVTEASSTAQSFISGLSSASLRGLGGSRTLVMLNGRRIDNYAFRGTFGASVDLHAIPLAAIERVEVLKDGASALYGSDAIGGVINFITRREFTGVDVFGSFSKTEDGGANSGRATLTGGTGRIESDGFNAFGVLDVRKAERLRGSDRPFSQMSFGPEARVTAGDVRTWPSNIFNGFAPDGTPIVVSPAAGPGCTPLTYRYQNPAFPSQNACRFNDALTSDLLPSSRQVGFYGAGTLRLSRETNLYTEVLASQSLIRHEDSPSAIASSAAQPAIPFQLPTSSPYYPAGLTLPSNWSLLYRAVPLGPATTEVDSRNVKVLAGVRSHQWGWDLDAAVSTNRSWARETYVSGMVDAAKAQAAFATGLVNPFGPSGPDGDALLAASELHGVSRESTGLTQSIDVRGVRLLNELPGGPLGLALGIEARRESIDDVQMPIAFNVLEDHPAPPKQGSRHVQGAYAEIVAPVLKGLELQAAGRVDHYSDFGTAFSPKLAVRFEPTSGVLLRASVGRGFRAPALNELFAPQMHSVLNLGLGFVSDPVRCPVTHLASDCSPILDLVQGGNPALQPQRSRQTNLGIVVAPALGWLASLDVWRIYIDSIITSINVNSIINNLALYDGSNVKRGPVDPAFPNLPGPMVRMEAMNQNLGDWRVSGADVSLQTAKPTTEIGRIWARVDATYVQYARQNLTNGNTVDQVGAVSPRWQGVASANLDRDRWSATLLYRYRHGYDEQSLLADGPPTRHVPAYQLWDAHVTFTATPSVKLLFGVENLLNTAPPFSITGDLLGYNPLYGDPRGRRWTIGLRASWT
jgi:iron complex outermembrane receptor protein